MCCYLFLAAIFIEPVKVGGDGGEAGRGADLATKDWAKAGDAREWAAGITDHKGTARVAITRAHAASGIDADDALPVHAAVVVFSDLVIKNWHGDLIDHIRHPAVDLVAGLAPTSHVHRLTDRWLRRSKSNGTNFIGELEIFYISANYKLLTS